MAFDFGLIVEWPASVASWVQVHKPEVHILASRHTHTWKK
jgi:hypothetical protein